MKIYTENFTIILNMQPAVRTEIKNYVKLLGFKSESDLCNKAILYVSSNKR